MNRITIGRVTTPIVCFICIVSIIFFVGRIPPMCLWLGSSFASYIALGTGMIITKGLRSVFRGIAQDPFMFFCFSAIIIALGSFSLLIVFAVSLIGGQDTGAPITVSVFLD